MKKLLIGMLILLTLLPIVHAFEICKEPIAAPCRIVTPVINCPRNYTLLDADGTILANRNMTIWNQSQYSFIIENITRTGRMMLRLCDNSSRELTIMTALTYIGNPPIGISPAVDLSQSSGVAIIFILIAVWFIIFITAMIVRNVAFMLILGIYTIVLGIFLCFVISVIAGGIVAVMGLGFMGWGALILRER